METVGIETERGYFTLEVGENSRPFLWLFHLTQDEWNKSEMNADIVTSRLVRYSGSNPQIARSFAVAVADLAQGNEPASGWGLWAGRYAKKFAAEKCKRDIKTYLLVLVASLLASGAIYRWMNGSEIDDILQTLLLVLSLAIVVSFCKVLLLVIDWYSVRKSEWPEHLRGNWCDNETSFSDVD